MSAWRIGIDPENRTDLAENGPYRWIRHPIYSGWLLMLLGSVLVVPHRAIDLGAIVTAIGVALQARREERHMRETFGERYARYAARTGRFMPRVGAVTTHRLFAEIREVLVSAAVVEARRRQDPAGDQSQALDRILDTMLVAAPAAEAISEVTLAMAGGLGRARIARVIHPYPTVAEAIRKATDA